MLAIRKETVQELLARDVPGRLIIAYFALISGKFVELTGQFEFVDR